MVTFINSCCEPDTDGFTDHDMLRASIGRAAEPRSICNGPCGGLSANAMWATPCAHCPILKEASIHG